MSGIINIIDLAENNIPIDSCTVALVVAIPALWFCYIHGSVFVKVIFNVNILAL